LVQQAHRRCDLTASDRSDDEPIPIRSLLDIRVLNGRVVMSGTGDKLLHDDRVRQACLGL
jgi:hypothetical protein